MVAWFMIKMMEKRILLVTWTIISMISVDKGVSVKADIDVDISSYDPSNEETHTFYYFLDNIHENSSQIIVRSNATSHLSGFYILQSHSFDYNVSLSHSGNMVENVTGRNVGILQHFQTPFETSFLIEKLKDRNSTILVAITIYDDAAPIPGGCSELKTVDRVSPSIQVIDGEDIITIKSESPCNASANDTKVEIYHKYLSSQNFNPYEYYGGIVSMLSIKDIRNNGRLVSTSEGESNIEKLFSSYIGVGEVFTILLTRNGKTSAFVPAVSYGENISLLVEKEKEGVSGEGLFIALFSALPLVAFVIIYWGHTLFHFTTFALGLSCGTLISFFVLSREGASTIDDKFLISLIIGILYGTVWVCIWYKCGIPLLSATLAFLHVGALIVCIIYHAGVADSASFHNDGLYWSLFFCIMFTCWFLLSVFTMHGHIFSCSFLGSYVLMITTLNYWMGGNLQYVVINVYRRLFVPNFNKVVLDPPFQPRDQLIALIGLFFLLHGFYKQVKNQRGRPPFPPHRSHHYGSETAPLLGDY